MTADGQPQEAYSDKAWKERLKSEDDMAKLEKAIENALTAGDFAKLGETLQKVSTKTSEGSEGTSKE